MYGKGWEDRSGLAGTQSQQNTALGSSGKFRSSSGGTFNAAAASAAGNGSINKDAISESYAMADTSDSDLEQSLLEESPTKRSGTLSLPSPTPASAAAPGAASSLRVAHSGSGIAFNLDDNDQQMGIIPRAIKDLFDNLEKRATLSEKFDFSVSKYYTPWQNIIMYGLSKDTQRDK